jgi:hypothetical protein
MINADTDIDELTSD